MKLRLIKPSLFLTIVLILFSNHRGLAQTELKLTAMDAAAFDRFGVTVSISGDYAIVGAYNNTFPPSESEPGSAYIFKRSGPTWTEEAKLIAMDGAVHESFGGSVSISNTIALVGAPHVDFTGTNSGLAYTFMRSGTTWGEETKLIVTDGALGDVFGSSVSISPLFVLVGAPGQGGPVFSGSAYIFPRSTIVNHIVELTAMDAVAGDVFGASVSLTRDYVLVGAPGDDDAGNESGSAYIFKWNGGLVRYNWTQEAKLTALDAAAFDRFGGSVSISGDYAIVGAEDDDDNGFFSGSAYIFKRSGPTWSQEAKLIAMDGEARDNFGGSVSIDADHAVVGADAHPSGSLEGAGTGSAYVFRRNGTEWSQTKLIASDALAGVKNNFGHSVSISGDYAIVGAYTDGTAGDESGSAYVFFLPTLTVSPTSLDFGSSDTVNTFLVKNSVAGTLRWAVETNQDWISVTPTSGITTTECDTVIVTIDRIDLETGNPKGVITVDSNGDTQTIDVHVDVPALSVDQTTLNFGSSSDSRPFSVTNSGAGTLVWTVKSNDEWINNIIPGEGSTPEGLSTEINVTVDRTGLDPDSYFGTVTINSNGGIATVIVNMEIEEMNFTSLVAASGLRSGDTETAFQIISIPGELEDPQPESLFGFIGRYKKKWRLFDTDNGVELNLEYPVTRNLNPGVGLVVIVKEAGKIITTGSGTFVTEAEFEIPLHAGWNLIGNPYNFDVNTDKLSLNSGSNLKLWALEKGWQDTVSTLQPWKGYAIAVGSPDVLKIAPFTAPNAANAASIVDSKNWHIQILAHCESAQDNFNFAGVRESAIKSRDRYDSFEPPLLAGYVALSFPHPEWGQFLSNYSADYRSPDEPGYIWDFEVRTNYGTSEVRLDFNLKELPQDMEVFLVDEILGAIKNLRTDATYSFVSGGADSKKSLRLIVGDRDFVEEHTFEIPNLPDSYELSQNFPNPFNPATMISYSLPKAEKVTLKIYNLLGKEVITLIQDEEKPVGRHFAIWDGQHLAGEYVASGVYVYQIQAGTFSKTKKMVLVR